MIKILFVCHGNICRSPMAEYILKDMTEKRGISDHFHISSCATSTEEIGSPVHQGTRQKLSELGISCKGKRAVQLKKSDYKEYDYLLGMDQWNIRNILRIIGKDDKKKVFRLLDFTDSPRDIADPWYTENFDAAYRDIKEGCTAFLEYLEKRYGSKGVQ